MLVIIAIAALAAVAVAGAVDDTTTLFPLDRARWTAAHTDQYNAEQYAIMAWWCRSQGLRHTAADPSTGKEAAAHAQIEPPLNADVPAGGKGGPGDDDEEQGAADAAGADAAAGAMCEYLARADAIRGEHAVEADEAYKLALRKQRREETATQRRQRIAEMQRSREDFCQFNPLGIACPTHRFPSREQTVLNLFDEVSGWWCDGGGAAQRSAAAAAAAAAAATATGGTPPAPSPPDEGGDGARVAGGTVTTVSVAPTAYGDAALPCALKPAYAKGLRDLRAARMAPAPADADAPGLESSVPVMLDRWCLHKPGSLLCRDHRVAFARPDPLEYKRVVAWWCTEGAGADADADADGAGSLMCSHYRLKGIRDRKERAAAYRKHVEERRLSKAAEKKARKAETWEMNRAWCADHPESATCLVWMRRLGLTRDEL